MSRDPLEPLNPYAPPKSASRVEPIAASPQLEGPDGPYKDQSSLVAILRVLLALMGLNGAIAAIVCLALNQETLDRETSSALVRTSAILAGITSLLFLATAFPFGRFLMQANRNARVLGRAPLGFTPGSMVWWFIVPLGNWVRPYQAVRAVWDASAPRRDGARRVETSSVLSPWWGAWLLHTLGSRMFTDLGSGDPAARNFLLVGSNLAAVALCFFAERLVRLLHERQVARAEEVALGIGEDDGDDDARLRVSRRKRRQSRTRRASREPTE